LGEVRGFHAPTRQGRPAHEGARRHGAAWIIRALEVQRQDPCGALSEGAEEAAKDADEMPKMLVTSTVAGG
jgi:hypothetical protein